MNQKQVDTLAAAEALLSSTTIKSHLIDDLRWHVSACRSMPQHAGNWEDLAEAMEAANPTAINETPLIDLKPRKVHDYRGQKTWIYKGHTITSETHRRGCYPHKVRTWTSSYIDGKHHVCGGLREAVKLIDSGKLQKAQA